ncbi:MAG: STAS domain-containing protein [Chloroflexales bacterium]
MTDKVDVIALPAYIRSTFMDSPIPSGIFDREGTQIMVNAAMMRLWNLPPDAVGQFNMITDPQLAATGSAEHHRRVMQGETVVLPPHAFDSYEAGLQMTGAQRRWVETTFFPLRDASGAVTHLGSLLRDVTHEIDQRLAIEAARSEIEAQRDTIESLSSPVVQIWHGILTVPLIGAIDSRRAQNITANLLEAIAARRARSVILDITGVPVVDTQVAQLLIQTAQACRLLGCEVALVGVGVEIAQTIVQLGVDLIALVTLADLQAGIAWAFRLQGLRVVQADGARPATRR